MKSIPSETKSSGQPPLIIQARHSLQKNSATWAPLPTMMGLAGSTRLSEAQESASSHLATGSIPSTACVFSDGMSVHAVRSADTPRARPLGTRAKRRGPMEQDRLPAGASALRMRSASSRWHLPKPTSPYCEVESLRAPPRGRRRVLGRTRARSRRHDPNRERRQRPRHPVHRQCNPSAGGQTRHAKTGDDQGGERDQPPATPDQRIEPFSSSSALPPRGRPTSGAHPPERHRTYIGPVQLCMSGQGQDSSAAGKAGSTATR